MRRLAWIAGFLGLAGAGAAAAATGTGRYAPHGFGALEPNAPALSTFGDDVIRVRAYPALGGATWMVQLHTAPNGSARGEAFFFERSSMREPWRRSGSVRLIVWKEDWEEALRRIDKLLAEGRLRPRLRNRARTE